MISLKRGEPKAIIKGGKYNNKILYISDPTKKCCENCNEDCSFDPCCEDCGGDCGAGINNNAFDMVDEDYIRSLKKKMSSNDAYKLKEAIRYGGFKGQNPDNVSDDDIEDMFNKIVTKSEDMSKKEFKLWDDGELSALPEFKKTFRYYICGPAGSGKSYYIGRLLKNMRKVCPKKKIYIFSDVNEDPELDSIGNIIRFKLDDDLVDKKPINPEILADSVCVFDDIDSIQNPKLLQVIEKLRDSLLRTGRHYGEGISVIVSNHLMTNYKSTRIILNECNAITFFPKSGATDAIKYTLKKYVGMSKNDINKIFDLPSRWVTVFKNADPCQYVMYSKGLYLL
jgi:hypothetical protein